MPLLSAAEADRLQRAGLTYDGGGLTRGEAPPGYRTARRRVEVGMGADRFREVAATVLSWGVQRRAGVGVRPSSESVVEGAVAVLRLGWGVVGVNAPVRVVHLVNEERRQGFAYGTLPGHPESGEESFVVELGDDGLVRFEIAAFSRPATLLARAGGPVTHAVQRWVTSRYLRAV